MGVRVRGGRVGGSKQGKVGVRVRGGRVGESK